MRRGGMIAGRSCNAPCGKRGPTHQAYPASGTATPGISRGLRLGRPAKRGSEPRARLDVSRRCIGPRIDAPVTPGTAAVQPWSMRSRCTQSYSHEGGFEPPSPGFVRRQDATRGGAVAACTIRGTLLKRSVWYGLPLRSRRYALAAAPGGRARTSRVAAMMMAAWRSLMSDPFRAFV